MKKALSLICIICLLVLNSSVAFGNTKDIYGEIDKYLSQGAKDAKIPGMTVIIVDKDNVLFTGIYGDSGVDTPFIIGSMSKSFTAVCIMQLVEQGKIELDKSISAYLPDISEGNKITVRQLLNQTSGLSPIQRVSNMKVTDSKGSHLYANVNYSLLGRIVESVSGKTYEEYITDNIFNPLGMTHSAASLEKSKKNGLISGYRNYFGFRISGEPDYPNENSWSEVPAGYLSASISDMGKYLQMYLNGGKGIVDPKSINTMFYDNVYVKADTPYYYGMGWTLYKNYSEPVLAHTGLVENFMSNMFILPDSGIGIAVLTNTNDYFVTNSEIHALSTSIALMLLGDEPIQVTSSKYWRYHLFFDGIYLIVLLIALIPFIFLLKNGKKIAKAKKYKTIIKTIILHIIVPTILLLIPQIIAGMPLWLVRNYVPDFFLVLVISASLLYLGGVIKMGFLYKSKAEEIDSIKAQRIQQ